MSFNAEEDTAIDYHLFQSLTNSINYGRSNEQADSEDSVFGRTSVGCRVGLKPGLYNVGTKEASPFT